MMPHWDAVRSLLSLLVIISVVAIVYGLLLRRIATFVQPLRLQLAERGEKYLVVCKDPKERRLITSYLDNALNPWVMICYGILLPIVGLKLLFKAANDNFAKADETEYNRMTALYLISVFAANPLFGTLVILEAFVMLLLAIVLSGKFNVLMRATMALIERLALKGAEHSRRHAPAH